jgi:MFS transporter, DHA1 family, multidrug resistance protein
MANSTAQSPASGLRSRPRGIVAMLAGLMALNALAIDSMLPALPAIGADLGVDSENDRQLVIIAYMLGFGSTQLLWGPAADRFGRKPVLALGIALYVLFAIACTGAVSFGMLITARALQGASAAVSRVLIVTIVRDLFHGEAMARTMSLVHMAFMLVPMLAPSLGQAILLVAPWRAIFAMLAVYGLVMLLWTWRRLPETLRPEHRRSLNWRDIASAAGQALGERQSLGYTLAMTAMFGSLTAYIASIQQIVFDVFRAPDAIGMVFAAIAAPMAVASFANSRMVGRYGLRRVGHAGVAAFVIVTLAHLVLALLMDEPLWLFIVMQGLTWSAFALSSANLGTLAMEHMSAIAGTASSVQGVIGTIGGALIGFAIGQSFNGTSLPFLGGIAGCAVVALVLTVLTEPRRLFQPRQPSDEADLLPVPLSEI